MLLSTGGLGPCQKVHVNSRTYGGALGHALSVPPPESLGTLSSTTQVLRTYTTDLPRKPWTPRLGEPPRLSILRACCQTSLRGELSPVSVTPLAEDSRKLVPRLSWTLPSVPFVFADFKSYTGLAINLNREYNRFSEFREFF